MYSDSIKKLVDYAIAFGILDERDRIYSVNRILMVLKEDEYAPLEESSSDFLNTDINYLAEILKELSDYAVNKKIISSSITERDLFDTKLMGCVTMPPSALIDKFNDIYKISKEKATDFFYNFSCASNYIRRDRIAKDMRWKVSSEYGDIDITINLSKPEKDPKAIAAAKSMPQSGYPKCLLCRQNEGYAGNLNYPARQNHRIIPLVINGTDWGFQYSPYVYYNEHCIVFNNEHIPMKIERDTFVKLLDFIEQFPHYFLGSNADLPIVGGSILSHDHYQGGRYTFAMEKAPVEKEYKINGYEDIYTGIVKWPLSVIRLRSSNKEKLIELAEHILNKWRTYTDEEAFIFAYTNEPHNTITPIARMRDNMYELDLALRNNITTKEYPLGVYHPHEKYHHIKKENIGLIEVMGLAILPSRLKTELEDIAEALVTNNLEIDLKNHTEWAAELKEKYTFTKENVMNILKEETGKIFVEVLKNAGVFKCDKKGREFFDRFMKSL